jgi:RNA polymerase sigma-70 factor (ECF subfamily)
LSREVFDLAEVDSHLAVFEQMRGRLFGLAYRMLGSRADAEDVVQDAYVRWHQAAGDDIRQPEGWLVTVTTRLAIDRLRALKTARDAYAGPWLPEPLLQMATPPPDRQAELASELSIAFMVLLERLGPEERAAFLLREVFDSGYPDIARILGRSEAACRQIVHRARDRVRGERKRFDATAADKASLLRRFTAAMHARDKEALLALFAPDAMWVADGGGHVPASPRPIEGAERIVKLVLGLYRQRAAQGATYEPVLVNGEPGLAVRIGQQLIATLAIDCEGERISAVYVVVNPEKLQTT